MSETLGCTLCDGKTCQAAQLRGLKFFTSSYPFPLLVLLHSSATQGNRGHVAFGFSPNAMARKMDLRPYTKTSIHHDLTSVL